MAAPPKVTMKDLSGKYIMNKTLSDDSDPVLALQGISWFVRRAIAFATIRLSIKQYVEKGEIHIDIVSVASGLSTTNENRTANWVEGEHEDKIFGKVRGKSRFFKIANFQMQSEGGDDVKKFLLGKTLKDGRTPSKFLEGDHLQSWVVSDAGGWTAEQTWGFEEISGKRYYTRRVYVRKGEQFQAIRLVYDYQGSLD